MKHPVLGPHELPPSEHSFVLCITMVRDLSSSCLEGSCLDFCVQAACSSTPEPMIRNGEKWQARSTWG